MADTTKMKSVREEDELYLKDQADARIVSAVRQEGYNREAMINAKLSAFEANVVNPKINDLRDELVSRGSSGNSNGIRYAGCVDAYDDLAYVLNPAHGDLYIVTGSDDGLAYVYTVYREAGGEGEEPVTRSRWAATHLTIDLTNYVTRDETCSLTDFNTASSNALDAKNKLNAAMLQLEAIKNKVAIPSTEKTLDNVNSLLGEIVTALSAAVKAYNGQL